MLEAISKLMEVQRLDNLIADAEEKTCRSARLSGESTK